MEPRLKADAAKAASLNQHRVNPQLRHNKSTEYWHNKVEPTSLILINRGGWWTT